MKKIFLSSIICFIFTVFIACFNKTENTTLPTPESSAKSLDELDSITFKALTTINLERAKLGKSAMLIETKLNCSALAHAKSMYEHQVCSQIGWDGSLPEDRARRCGTEAKKEVIACKKSIKDILNFWNNDLDVRKILTDEQYTTIGIAMYNDYWVIDIN